MGYSCCGSAVAVPAAVAVPVSEAVAVAVTVTVAVAEAVLRQHQMQGSVELSTHFAAPAPWSRCPSLFLRPLASNKCWKLLPLKIMKSVRCMRS